MSDYKRIDWEAPDYIQIGSDVEAETPKALLVNVRNRQIWVPKSLLAVATHEIYGETYAVPMWFASREMLRY